MRATPKTSSPTNEHHHCWISFEWWWVRVFRGFCCYRRRRPDYAGRRNRHTIIVGKGSESDVLGCLLLLGRSHFADVGVKEDLWMKDGEKRKRRERTETRAENRQIPWDSE